MSENHITVIEDNDPVITFTITVDSTAIVITGYTIVMSLYTSKDTETPAFTYTTAAPSPAITISTPQSGTTKGQCVVQLNRTDFATPTTYYYRLDVTDLNSKKLTYSYGHIVVKNV